MIYYDNAGHCGCFGSLFRWRGSVIPTSLMVALPSGALAVLISLLNDGSISDSVGSVMGTDKIKASQLWAAMSATLAFLIGFRTNKAYQRFWDGTTLLHQMWGEWFDASSCLFAFSQLARKDKPTEVANFRHALIRLMSLLHGSALEEIAGSLEDEEGYLCLDVGGLDQKTLSYLKECKFNPNLNFNRVEVLIHMIQNLIVENQDNGVLKIPPPILSRVFQTLSRGQVNLANSKKITTTMFPFPYAQVIAWLLVAFVIGTPMAMASILEKTHWACIFTVVPVFGLVALNLVAGEIEMPFGDDANDLPLDEFQDHMNNSMLMLIRDETDLVPRVNEQHAHDFNAIKLNISTKRPKHFVMPELLEKRGADLLVPRSRGEGGSAIEITPAEKPRVSVGVPAPTDALQQTLPAPPPVSCKVASTPEHSMAKKIEELVGAFDELMVNTRALSANIAVAAADGRLSENMRWMQDVRTATEAMLTAAHGSQQLVSKQHRVNKEHRGAPYGKSTLSREPAWHDFNAALTPRTEGGQQHQWMPGTMQV